MHFRYNMMMIALLLVSLAACTINSSPNNDETSTANNTVKGFKGRISADEPIAALEGRRILQQHGTAIDAAIATMLSLQVTLPSYVSLEGGGQCIVTRDKVPNDDGGYDPSFVKLYNFPLSYDTHGTPHGALLNGLVLMHSDYGTSPWPSLVIGAETLARFGYAPSRISKASFAKAPKSLAKWVQHYLVQDTYKWQNLTLAETLAQIRVNPIFFDNHIMKQSLEEQYKALNINYDPSFTPAISTQIFTQGHETNNSYMQVYDKEYYIYHYMNMLPDDHIKTILSQSLAHKKNTIFSTDDQQFLHDDDTISALLRGHERNRHSVNIMAADTYGYMVNCNIGIGQAYGAGQVLPNLGILAPSNNTQPMNPLFVIRNNTTDQFRLAIGQGLNQRILRCNTGLRQDTSLNECQFISGDNQYATHLEAF